MAPRTRRVVTELGWVAGYLLLGRAAVALGELGALSIWYLPAGLALAVGNLRGWQGLPAIAVGEVLVGALVFGVLDDFGWPLLVANGVAYAAVYVGAGRLLLLLGGLAVEASRRRPGVIILLGALVAPAVAAVVGVAFQRAAGLPPLGPVAEDVAVWWLGDAVGIATITLTVTVVAVRARRGERWWALPDVSFGRSALYALSPALLGLVLAAAPGAALPFAALLFAPYLLLAVAHGLPGVALAAPPTSVVVTLVAARLLGPDVLGRTDLQVLLLTLLATGFGAALITEERAALRRDLAARSQHLREAQAQTSSGSFLLDVPSGRVRWTTALYDLLDRAEPTVDRDTYAAAVHPDDRAGYLAVVDRSLREHTDHDHVHRLVRGDGRVLVVRARGTVRVRDGVVQTLLGTSTDVTREEATAERLAAALLREQEARAAEREATAAVTRAERVKDALLVAVSHEVRTPLTMVRGLSETLARPELADHRLGAHHRHLDQLQQHALRLQDVLTDLLDVDRIGRGVVEPVRRPTALRPLVEDVLAARDDDLVVELDVPDEVVLVDGRLVARIVEHLVANARRHGDGSVGVRVTLDDDLLELSVDDHGPGVPVDERSEVFDAFVHGEVDPASPGAGVGLHLVQRFAELHDGKAWVTDRADGRPGAVFGVALPLAAPDGDG